MPSTTRVYCITSLGLWSAVIFGALLVITLAFSHSRWGILLIVLDILAASFTLIDIRDARITDRVVELPGEPS